MTDLQRAHNDWLDPDSPRTCSVPRVSDEWLEDRRLDERMEMMAMMAIDDGGPAFPFQAFGTDGLAYAEPCWGMSLRDYISIEAMKSHILAFGTSDRFRESVRNAAEKTGHSNAEAIIAMSFDAVDVWFAERDRRKKATT